MTDRIKNLLLNSGLPGPRGNLELMYTFAKSAATEEIEECLSYEKADLHNCPEEFVMMCGITAYCVKNQDAVRQTVDFIRPFASHQSWRVREAVAIGIQLIADRHIQAIIALLKEWANGSDLEKRAVVAALCEPRLLKERSTVSELFDMLEKMILSFNTIEEKLTDNRKSLRKTLGYGLSVAVAALPDQGKALFEKLATATHKHIRWIIKENLKKNRLKVMDKDWVEKMFAQFH